MSVTGSPGIGDDLARDHRPDLGREVVPHPGHHHQAGAGDGRGDRLAAARADERVVGAVDDDRRRAHAPQLARAVAGVVDRMQLAGDAGAALSAVIGGERVAADPLLLAGKGRGADRVEDLDDVVGIALAVARRLAQQRPSARRRGTDAIRLPAPVMISPSERTRCGCR